MIEDGDSQVGIEVGVDEDEGAVGRTQRRHFTHSIADYA